MDGMKVVQDKGIAINHVTGLLKLKRVKVEQEWRRVVIKNKTHNYVKPSPHAYSVVASIHGHQQ
jgi:hypothetical protein